MMKAKKDDYIEESDSDDEEERDVVPDLNDIDYPKKKEGDLDKFAPDNWKDYLELIDTISYGIPIYYSEGTNDVIFFCIHGAGLTGTSFSLLAKEVKPFASLITYDIRGHGFNKNEDKEPYLGIDYLITEAKDVLSYIVEKHPEKTIVIVGHSLGSSIACRLANHIGTGDFGDNLKERVVGVIMIDVSEGHSLNALKFMRDLVLSRPSKFPSINKAIKYIVAAKNVNNVKSAKLSTEAQLVKLQDSFVWRVDLLRTEKYWEGWFTELNMNFLQCNLPKILLLAAADRMDKELTIAHMQGRFRLVVLSQEVGHHVHEDAPKETGAVLKNFLKLFKIPLGMKQKQEAKNMGPGLFKNGLE